MKRVIWMPVIIALLLACADKNTLDSLIGQESRYSYTGFDSTGVTIVQGWIEIQMTDSATVIGQWDLSPVGNAEHIGPQTGSGELSGFFEKGKISLDLNPENRDNNVLLHGNFNRENFEGQWSYVGFAGVVNSGSFKASH